jgi:hypothetical protein
MVDSLEYGKDGADSEHQESDDEAPEIEFAPVSTTEWMASLAMLALPVSTAAAILVMATRMSPTRAA